MTQSAKISISLAAQQSIAPRIAGGPPVRTADVLEFVKDLADGTGDNQFDAPVFSQEFTIAAAAVEAIELDALIAQGGATTFSKIKAIAVKNRSASGYVTLGGGTGGKTAPNTDAWSDTDGGVDLSPFSSDAASVAVHPGGLFLWVAPEDGVPVVNTTAQILGIEAFTVDQDVDVWIMGLG